MKILMCSYSGYGAWFTIRLYNEGHKVDYYLMDKKYENVLAGIAPEPMFERPDFSKYDLILFDLTGKPAVAEKAALTAPVLGDGNLQTLIEEDRFFGIDVMEKAGITIPPYEVFNDINAAKKFIQKTNKKYVFKPDGGQEQDTNTTYVSESAEDLLEYIDRLGAATKGATFLLQEVVKGTEISTEAYFNGEDFYLINATLEEKKFMNGNKGPNTGCAGNLVWVYDDKPAIFREGLEKMKPFLQESGYRGMIDLNTIATENKLYGLEWTPRFGYDASATLFALIKSDLGEFFHAIATGATPSVQFKGRFGAGIRLSIPPYPTEVPKHHPVGIPIQGIDEDNLEQIFLYDAMLDFERDELVTAGVSGFIAVPMAIGQTINEAWCGVHELIEKIKIPDCQYRTDIHKTTMQRYNTLDHQGWFV